jgi:hypothetical protein
MSLQSRDIQQLCVVSKFVYNKQTLRVFYYKHVKVLPSFRISLYILVNTCA